MSDVVSGDDWVASPEQRESMRESAAAAVQKESRRGAGSPREIRAEDGWARAMDSMAVTDELVARSGSLVMEDGELFLRVRCYGCQLWAKMPVPERMLSPVAVKIAQRWLCEKCSLEDDESAVRAKTLEGLTRRMKESGLPKALADAVSWESMIAKAGTPDDHVKRQRAIDHCRGWADELKPTSGITLYGPAGTGKTRLAATLAVSRLAHSPLKWISVGVLMAELAGAWNDDDRKAALKVLTSTVPVVLDDFDKVNPTKAVLAQLFTALDKREQAGSLVVVTTNLKPSELEKKLGEVIVSRLLGMTVVLPFPGPDKRIEIGEGA